MTHPLQPTTTGRQCRARMLALVVLGMLSVASSPAAAQDWRLDEGEYIPAKMEPVLVFPRPEDETAAWARYRKTYPGLAYRVPVAIQGGAWPFHHELTEAPEGMRIGDQPDQPDYGVIVWDNPIEGRHEVALKVTDQDLTEVSVNWTLDVTADKTLFLSPDGDDSNPGTLEQPKQSFAGWHLDDTNDDTYAGYHVIMRGGEYPWAGMASRNNNIQLHQFKPLVFLAYPGEEPIMDMSGGKFFGHRTGDRSGGGTPDLFIHGITFQNGDQSRKNAHFFWITSREAGRLTLFENTFRDLGPGQEGSDNPSVCFVSDTSTRKSYFAHIGNTYENLGYSSNGVSLFDHYYTDYTVFENNRFTHGIKSRFGAWSKHHDDLVTYRRNIGMLDRVDGDGGLLVFNPDSTTPEAKVEFCWNYLGINGRAVDRSAAVVMFNHSMREGGHVWAYRNTIIGRIESRKSESSGRARVAENNVVVNDGTISLKNLDDIDNVTGTPDDGIIDDAGKLQGEHRQQHLGTHGWELRSTDTAFQPSTR